MTNLTRRGFVKLAGGLAAVGVAAPRLAHAAAKSQVVVIGGGYGGAIAAKYIRMMDANIDVTLIEASLNYVSCPLSNPILIEKRDLAVQTWDVNSLQKHGIKVVIDMATDIDPVKKKVTTKSGKEYIYDRLVVSPGVDFKWGAIPGYDEAAAELMPHAWKAGPQTTKLRDKLKAMPDGEPFIIVAPPNPYRCPPGPYERASLVAYYLKQHKPKSKVIILDPKDKFSKQGLFTGGWQENGLNIEWVPGANGGKVASVDAKAGVVKTEMEEYKSSCVNVIPPMMAGEIAKKAGLTNESGFCPVDFTTFESTLHKDIHVIGDSCIAGAMPKSGYAANSQGKVVAAAIVALLNGKPVGEPSYVNTCYSLITPDYGISVAGIYKMDKVEGKDTIKEVKGGVSPAKASPAFRKQEALYAESWYQSIMADMFL
ncbi:MAG: FAD-dependent oxidoreductase [Magnetococcales bacterium]|nr:FAD-dependent oxidoreductase [Magnetococcales bacterium]